MNIDEMAQNDPETAAKLQRLKEKLGLVPATPEEQAADALLAEAAAENEAQAPVEPVAPPQQLTGADVDWSEFDLDANLAHLYPQARLVNMLEGPKWVAMLDVFEFETGEYKVSKAKKAQGVQNLGDIVTQRFNGPEQWRVVSMYGSGPGFGVVCLSRRVQIVLPDPRQLRTEAEMPAPQTDVELQAAEDAALGWIDEQGQAKEEEAGLLTDLMNLTPAEIAAAKPAAEPRLFGPTGDYSKEQSAASAETVEKPSAEQIAAAGLNPETVRVPRGAGLNATDGEGTILDTTVQVPAVQALEAGQQAAEAMMGPDFETAEGKAILDEAKPLEQIELPLLKLGQYVDGEQA